MCGVCGCAERDGSGVTVQRIDGKNAGRDGSVQDHAHDAESGPDHFHAHAHVHSHGHSHHHCHDHSHSHSQGEETASPGIKRLEAEILGKNDRLAAQLRDGFAADRITTINLVSGPGAGKTSLLEATLRELDASDPVMVIEGDQETLNDAERIRATGRPVVQINTGAGCHLEADMVQRGLEQLAPEPGTLLFVENVGNLVCPAMFDLGEGARVAILSVTEGEDKPLKYPHMIRSSRLLLLSKVDLLPHLDFDIEQCEAYARQINPDIEILRVSSRSGAGMAQWLAWLDDVRAEVGVATALQGDPEAAEASS